MQKSEAIVLGQSGRGSLLFIGGQLFNYITEKVRSEQWVPKWPRGRSSVGEDIKSARVEPWGRRVLSAEGNKSPKGRENKGIN